MSPYEVGLTTGFLARHAPGRSAQGRSAALIDVAQDLLLRELHDRGVLDLLAFKGGTAIRKVYAGAAGRFSTDLDFSVRNLDDDPRAIEGVIAEVCEGLEVGGITFGVLEHRGKLTLTYSSSLAGNASPLTSKLDLGPPPWLEPANREWVPLPIHDVYGGSLPSLPVVSLEENVAEKMARLNRRTYARDVFDLVWIAKQPGILVDRTLVRRLLVLKCWVDLHGLHSTHHDWVPAQSPLVLDVEHWLRPRTEREFDDEQIGLLTTPAPDLTQLGAELPEYYSWLGELDEDETAVAHGDASDRPKALAMLGDLPGHRLKGQVW